MTRKKWNRLRRQRPVLFGFLPPWEKMNAYELALMRPVSKAEAITTMTTYLLTREPSELQSLWPSWLFDEHTHVEIGTDSFLSNGLPKFPI